MNTKNIKLRTWLVAGFLVVVLLLIATAVAGILAMRKQEAGMAEMADNRFPAVSLSADLLRLAQDSNAQVRTVVSALSADTIRDANSAIGDNLKASKLNIQKLATLSSDEQLASLFKDVVSQEKTLGSTLEKFRAKAEELAADPEQITMRQQMLLQEFIEPEFGPVFDTYTKTLDKFVAGHAKAMEASREVARSVGKSALLFLISMTITSVALAIVTAFLISRSVSRPLFHACEVASAVAAGDLSFKVNPRFVGASETGKLLSVLAEMQGRLSVLLDVTKRNAYAVGTATHGLKETSELIANGSSQQLDATQAIAATVEEFAVSVSHISDQAHEVGRIARDAEALALTGSTEVTRASQQMEEIASEVSANADRISALDARIREVATVVSAIREVADRTNLLSLNASIEAARAGESGRGFAVVADEIRQLADRTAKATSEINAIVAKVRAEAEQAVVSMSGTRQRVTAGVATSKSTLGSMDRIVAASREVLSAATIIAQSLGEQRAASEEVARQVERIVSTTERNAAGVADTATSINKLETMADDLVGAMAHFRV